MERQALLRRRCVHPYAVEGVGVKAGKCSDDTRGPLGVFPAIAFVVGYTVYVAVGITCCLLPPRARMTAAGEAIPSDSTCYRAIRKADYVAVEYALGGPTRRTHVLLRLDKVVDDTESSVRIFSERIVESKSLRCDVSNTSCFDTVLLTQGEPNKPLGLFGLQFWYTNPTSEYYTYGVAKHDLSLSGEMYAARGYRYWITNTHVCVSRNKTASDESTDGALESHVAEGGQLFTNGSAIAAMPISLFNRSAVYHSHNHGECESLLGSVALFPVEAAVEAGYLAVVDTTLYEAEPDSVSIRRNIAELGYSCASTLPRYEKELNLYLFDCNNNYAKCRTTPSLPFRRLADTEMRARYTADGRAYFWFKHDATLQTLPGLQNTSDAVWTAILKLGMLVLAAAVMWVRSDRATSCARWLFMHCLEIANCVPGTKHTTASGSIAEDAVLGLSAICARFAVAAWRLSDLAFDDQSRVCVTEIVASCVSLASWLLRFWVISPNVVQLINGAPDTRGPLTRLGGSMAVVDSSCAVMMAFAEPPLHLSAVSRFDNTARLLTGLLLTLVTLRRAAFGSACNAVLFEAHYVGTVVASDAFAMVLIVAVLMWLVQIAAVAVAGADLVATPLAFSVTRGVLGDDTIVGPVIFLAVLCASLPRLLHTAVKLVDRQGL